MTGGIKTALSVLVLFIVVLQLINTMITGTDTGSVMIQTIGPLLMGVAAILAFVKIGTSQG